MSSPTSILTTLSDFTDKNKHEHYDSNTCKNIQTKLDEEIKSQGLSYEERFQLARKNITFSDKWSAVFPNGISQCLQEYWKERVSTAPLDPRFPNVNQSKRCWVNYVDYHRCMDLKDNEKVCSYFKHLYVDLCPGEWVTKWDEQMERQAFPGIHK